MAASALLGRVPDQSGLSGPGSGRSRSGGRRCGIGRRRFPPGRRSASLLLSGRDPRLRHRPPSRSVSASHRAPKAGTVAKDREADGLHPGSGCGAEMTPPERCESGATRHRRRQIHQWGRRLRSRQNQRRLIRPRHPKSGIGHRPPEHPSHSMQANHCRATGHRRHHSRPETENGRVRSTNAPRWKSWDCRAANCAISVWHSLRCGWWPRPERGSIGLKVSPKRRFPRKMRWVAFPHPQPLGILTAICHIGQANRPDGADELGRSHLWGWR